MKYRVGTKITFEAAHYLPMYSGECRRLHGHTYTVIVEVEGKPKNGMVLDFKTLRQKIKGIISNLDHYDLNTMIDYPTAENIATWIFKRLKEELPDLYKVRVYEGLNNYAEVYRDS